MAIFRKTLSVLGDNAKSILAIVGIIGIGFSVYQFVDNWIESFNNASVFIRPICEISPIKSIKLSDGSDAKHRLIGFEIRNEKDVSDLRIKLTNILFIEKWSMVGDNISEEESNKLLSTLPTGNNKNKEIFLNIPRIMAKGITVVHANVVTDNSFKPSGEWVFGSSNSTKVVHGLLSENLIIREGFHHWDGSGFYEMGFWTLLALIIIYWIYNKAKIVAAQETAEKEGSPPAAPNAERREPTTGAEGTEE